MSGKLWRRSWQRVKLPWRPPSTVSLASTSPDETPKQIPQGLYVVFEGEDPVVDILAVHGLNGHLDKTWTAANGTHWLRDLLPEDIPHSRILLWGYDSRVRGASRVSSLNIEEHAQNLVSDLCLLRETTNTMKRPIIVIAHSLGGLIVKSAMLHSDRASHGSLQPHRSIALSTHAIIYMSTPHQGGNGAQLGQMLANIASVFVPADDHLIRHLRQDSEWLKHLSRDYGRICDAFVTKFAYEEYETPIVLGHSLMVSSFNTLWEAMSTERDQVVPRSSAVPADQSDAEPIVIHADHKNMVKYSSREDDGYRTICGHIQILISSSSGHVKSKWEMESRIDEARHKTIPNSGFSLPLSLVGVSEAFRFIARENELQQLHGLLTKAESRRIAVLHGLGGVGKTQLSVAYAKSYEQHYSAVIWLNAKDETSLRQSFSQAAERIWQHHASLGHMRVALESGNSEQILAAVKQWLDQPNNVRWLLIFDNYDNPEFGSIDAGGGTQRQSRNKVPAGYDIRSYFPYNYQGAIIVTTRIPIIGVGEMLPLGKFQHISASLELLSMASHREEVLQDPAAIELVRHLDGLPLALSTAGAYLYQVSTSCSEYLELYRNHWLQLQQSSPTLLTYDNRALYSTWDVTYAQLKQKSEPAAMLLKLWAYFDNQDLWYELLGTRSADGPPWLQEITRNRICFDMTMRLICNHGLAEANSDPEYGVFSRGYSVHQCVHAWMKYALNPEPDVGLALIAVRSVAFCDFESDGKQKWQIQRRLLSHVEVCSSHSIEELETEEIPLIYQSLGGLCSDQQNYEKAMSLLNKGLDISERRWGPDHVSSMNLVFGLGGVLNCLERYIEAEENYTRILRTAERLFGPNHQTTLRFVGGLALNYAMQERFVEAEARFQQILAGKEIDLGLNHVSTLWTVNSLGIISFELGRYDVADAFFQRALRGKEALLTDENISTLKTIYSLGDLYKECGNFTKAKEFFDRSLSGLEGVVEIDHVFPVDVLMGAGDLYVQQGDFGKAETTLYHALEEAEELLGPAHLTTLDAVYYSARLHMLQALYNKSEGMYIRALEGYKNKLGGECVSALKAKSGLGELYRRQGRFEEAAGILQQVLQGREKVLSPSHPSTLSTVNEIGLLFAAQNQFEKSHAMHLRALEGYQQAFGADCDKYIFTLNTLESIGDVLSHLGKPSEARTYYCRALSGFKILHGSDSPRYRRLLFLLEER
ncbi:unnamed protein product [Clonostachys rosea]|uniref:NB-ARC domain-containing protein n=1 Tax=Bionectria ochroleuca TaxID=29856 RepID=A0ABY6UCJ0_BIOOC|nr:unnamed protein product [Clonostachys rosea]